MVSDLVERNRTEEPDAGVPHVRICGEGAGQPVPLPGELTCRFVESPEMKVGRKVSYRTTSVVIYNDRPKNI
jgi:hypothetical protein